MMRDGFGPGKQFFAIASPAALESRRTTGDDGAGECNGG
jgi:hypothetical protein